MRERTWPIELDPLIRKILDTHPDAAVKFGSRQFWVAVIPRCEFKVSRHLWIDNAHLRREAISFLTKNQLPYTVDGGPDSILVLACAP